MRVQFLKATEFRGKKYKKNAKAELPISLAFKLISNSLAKRV